MDVANFIRWVLSLMPPEHLVRLDVGSEGLIETPARGGLLTSVGRCPKRYFTATARGHAAMHCLALSLRSERWRTPRDALKVFGVK